MLWAYHMLLWKQAGVACRKGAGSKPEVARRMGIANKPGVAGMMAGHSCTGLTVL